MREKTPQVQLAEIKNLIIRRFAIGQTLIIGLVAIGYVFLVQTAESNHKIKYQLEQAAQQTSSLSEILYHIHQLEQQVMVSDAMKHRNDIETLLDDLEKSTAVLAAAVNTRELSAVDEINDILRSRERGLPVAVDEFSNLIADHVMSVPGKISRNVAEDAFKIAQFRITPGIDSVVDHLSSELSRRKTIQILVQVAVVAAIISSIAFLFLYIAGLLTHQFRQFGKPSEEEILQSKLLRYDIVTGLPNKNYAQRYLEDLTLNARNTDFLAAVIHIRVEPSVLKHSKSRSQSREISRDLSRLITSVVRSGDFVASLDNFEFLVVASTFNDHRELHELAHAIYTKFSVAKIDNDHPDHAIEVNIGVAFMDETNNRAETILTNANIAADFARSVNHTHIQFFTPSLLESVDRRSTLHAELLAALEHDAFEPYFQPVIDATTDEVQALEVLVRWKHEHLGFLIPGHFWVIAEEFQLATDITTQVLSKTLRASARWIADGRNVPQLSINVSRSQLATANLIDTIISATEQCNFPIAKLSIEIDEQDIYDDDLGQVHAMLLKLVELGASVTVDNFGRGLIDIGDLTSLSVREVKVSRAFVANIDVAGEPQAHVSMIIRHAKKLGIAVTAVGVESEAELMMLKHLECDNLQGYMIAKPMSAPETYRWLSQNRKDSAIRDKSAA